MGELNITKQEWIILAGEEAGPKSNKMGGIWNVIDSEASTLASLIDSGKIENSKENISKILVFGPYYGYKGADWNKGLNRITDMSEFESLDMDEELAETIEAVKPLGIEIITGSRKIGNIDVMYLMFKTDNFSRCTTRFKNREMSLEDKIKSEAYDLVGLDSLTYQNLWNGMEYTHYLNLSYAISEFIRTLITIKEKDIKEQSDIEISEFAKSLMPSIQISIHGHEFGVFYAIARLEKLGIPVRTVATFHATLPGRSAGYRSIEKINNNDSTWVKDVPSNLASLESLAKYADIATAVGDSTRKEAKLFYGLDPIVVRNGITLDKSEILWDKKTQNREKIQKFLSKRLHEIHNGELIPYKKIIPVFTISRIEIENKGYSDLMDSLVLLDRMIKTEMLIGRLDEDVRVVCFLISAQGPKDSVPEGFPVNLPREFLMGEEHRMQQMIENRKLGVSNLTTGNRCVSALFYPQILSEHDGGLNMKPDDIMSGCIAGIFPSRYEPFLLTGLETGKEATPSIVSKVCGFSDALKTLRRLVMGMGGVIVVDNLNISYNETVMDYALSLDYFIDSYLHDRVKYNLLCQEAHLLAEDMNWEQPTMEYYELLTGKKIT